MAFLLSILETNFAWRPSIITKTSVGFLNLAKVYAPLQTVRSQSISSMHIWSFPVYKQECFQQDICTLFIKFTSFHHTKFHTKIDFFNFNACLLKERRKNTLEIVQAYCSVVHMNHEFLASDLNHKYSGHRCKICIHTSQVSN
jgi:hypothetical protein